MAACRFTHTNLVARDWRALAAFYERVFGCERKPPERNLSGAWLDRATGLEGVKIQGAHLVLPGYGPQGPTLEVFGYENEAASPSPAPNRPGFGHIAFAVDDVPATCAAILEQGGSMVGEITTVLIAGAGEITFAYATDPEGNIIEVQRWTH